MVSLASQHAKKLKKSKPYKISREKKMRYSVMHLLVLSSMLGVSAFSHAETAATQKHYQVASGDLGQALSNFALQSNIALSFDPKLTQGYKTNGLSGSFDIAQGFQQLLKDTDLQLVQQSPRVWRIERRQMSKTTTVTNTATDSAVATNSHADNPAAKLETIVVTANQLGEITENSGSYTPGKIATATRLVLTPKETPQTISVITRQLMDDFQLNNIDQVMSHTPGITVSAYDSERTSYYSRGFAINNFQYDGIPSTTRNVGYAAGNTLSDSAIYDRVEVLKGATGLLTGVGSLGATINLVRKKPTAETQASLSLSAGSWNNYRAMADVSGSLNDEQSIRGRFVAAGQDKESFMDRYERKSAVFYGIVEADLGDKTLVTLGADYQNNDPKASTWSGSFPLFNGAGERNPDPDRSFNNGANWSEWKQYTRTIFANVHHKFNDDWALTLQYDHKINGYDATLGTIQGYYPKLDGSANLWPSQYIGRTVSDSLELYSTGKFELLGRQHDLVLGASGAYSRWKGKDWYGGMQGYDSHIPDFSQWDGNIAQPNWGEPNAYTHDRTTQYGAYASTRLNLADDLKVLLGTRMINYKMKGLQGVVEEKNRFIPYVGVVYDITDRVSAYASLSDIFMPYDIWYKSSTNKILDPDEGKNYEGGFKFQSDDAKLNASIAYFEIHESNRAIEDIVYNGAPSNPAVDFAWIGTKAKTKGVEIEASGEVFPNVQVQSGYTYKQIKDHDGEKISTWEPEHQFNVSTQYKFDQQLDGLSVGGNVRWQNHGWQTVYNNVKKRSEVIDQKAFVLVDLMANYQFNEQLSTAINLNNIFDQHYFTNIGFYNSGVYGEPRNFMLSVKYKY
ncbi:TonB-dependent receptor [Acinetobacter guillouiae]|uniref:TonB-dependent siderophore receptor n=1 Tax=Acinetobacter guillouiae TaxID=106649 RepID=UPI00125EF62C